MGYREYTDHDGVAWQVWDTRPDRAANVRAPYAGGWLSFECETERRRLQPIPDAWAEAVDERIGEWLGQAEVIRQMNVRGELEPQARPGAGAGAEEPPSDAPASRKAAIMENTRSAVRRARAVIDAINAVVEGTRSKDQS